jgi:hypothetical protein
MPVSLLNLPPEPSSNALKKSFRTLQAAHETSKDLLSTFDRPAGQPRLPGIPSVKEQDLLRAMLIFSGAGLDSSLKQVIRASTLELFETDPEIEKSVATLFTKIDAKDIAVYLLKPSPRHAMIEDTIDDLTGSSLQSTFELERIIGFLHLDRQKIIGSAKQDTKKAFDTRNKIIHELDVSGETPAAGVHFRTRRNRDEMTKQANTILRVAFAFLAEVDKKLGH